MAVTRCPSGHFYDNSKSISCPYCNPTSTQNIARNTEHTQYVPSSNSTKPETVKIEMNASSGDDQKTVGMFKSKLGCDPVVGWLVCTRGKEKGRSYQLHSGRNFIGRALKSDIAITDDPTISREDHCTIVFEPIKNKFLLVRGLGENVFIEGEPLLNSATLSGDETIELGSSSFVFIPYCKEGRSW